MSDLYMFSENLKIIRYADITLYNGWRKIVKIKIVWAHVQKYFFMCNFLKIASQNKLVTLLKIIFFYSCNYSLPIRRKKVTSVSMKTNVILNLPLKITSYHQAR